MYSLLSKNSLKISEKCVPQRKTKNRKNKYQRERRRFWSKIQNAKNNITKMYRRVHNENIIKETEEKINESFEQEQNMKEKNAVNRMKEDPKYLYKFANQHAKTKSTIGPLKDKNGNFTDNDK